jgi:hypothetical protein
MNYIALFFISNCCMNYIFCVLIYYKNRMHAIIYRYMHL